MKGYSIHKTLSGINLIKIGFNCYSTKGNTQLGKAIKSAQKELKNCVVWYEVKDVSAGVVDIIYKDMKDFKGERK